MSRHFNHLLETIAMPLRSHAELRLIHLIHELIEFAGPGFDSFEVRTHSQGISAVLSIGPGLMPDRRQKPMKEEKIKDSDKDVLDLFRNKIPPGRKLPADLVYERAMECGLKWSIAVIRQSLSNLSRRGELANDRDKRGYYLPINAPKDESERLLSSH